MTVAPWDPGLQSERTGLAWQRTMLAGLTCSLLVARLLASVSIFLSVILGLMALLCTAGLGWLAIRRFRLNNLPSIEKKHSVMRRRMRCSASLSC